MTSFKTLTVNDNVNSYGYKTNNAIFGNSTNMWLIKENDNAIGYWIASPSYRSSSDITFVNYDGIMGVADVCGSGPGFRPVVVIPKSSI